MFELANHATMGVRRMLGASLLLMPILAGCGATELGGGEDAEDVNIGASNQELAGNGAPSGPHFNLNIIGVKNKLKSDITTGGRIFVPLSGSTKVLLSEGDFEVLDGNGTDGSAAFQLPDPDADGDGVTSYSVFARALGKPGGSSSITPCAADPVTGEELCSVAGLVLVRSTGKSRFENVSKALLFIEADVDGDGANERVSLFDDSLEDFVWQIDNQGLHLAQLRFYPIDTDVN
jgi:hypothetical protein